MSQSGSLALSSWIPDLVTPHPNSWVAFIASIFRVMAYMILAPIIILTITDIAAWAIARTLGASLDSDSNTTQKPKEARLDHIVQPATKTGERAEIAKVDLVPQLELPHSPSTFATDLRFTTPGEANYELSGLFSPPISRAGSPGISLSSHRLRSFSTSLSAAGSDSEGAIGEGRINKRHGLGMTPMDDGLRASNGDMTRRRAARSSSES
ncbi:unnamed protein product [Rhizoctonia solani]|uniref:Uncharacterized protein n=1 Tax=Rhizoctonia solani TaxID=456999 RepID=A0A8H2Y1J8_9AGAM|nr:uncharacterized protein RhiXN_06362 [Rhizoctonia solani]KAF8678115.1 hypothetical protein RHS04_05537 [Rhizoctonia solani]KAF8757127.1 hypothetical protein RHS01_03989 [Rhizoctonia solani]QRW21373.1 hypothetical protein RhiXN_06362 [Rhizoctonia solani]CAE6439655.1 unnamed protein product [Rhizoctonia solani]